MSSQGSPRPESLAVILDVDGTLVDTAYHHALAWHGAMRDHEIDIPVWILHRHVGMGGDQLVPAVAGDEVEARLGDGIRDAHDEHYRSLIDEVRPLPGARELLRSLKKDGFRVSLASSAKKDELDHYLDLLDAQALFDDRTDASDVSRTKPDPEMVERALEGIGGPPAVLVGDSTWDCIAADSAGIPSIGVLTGGYGEAELVDAGASIVCRDLDAVAAYLASPIDFDGTAGG